MQRIDQSGRRDDGGAVLIVVKHRDIEQLAQPLLDDEALRRLDVFQIDAAPALAEIPDAVDELVRIFGVHAEIDGIDVGEALEQHRLAFHHRLGGECAVVAEPEDRGTVGDHGDEIALGGIVVRLALVGGDRQHRHRDSGRIRKREIALRRHRLGRDHLQLARPALAVEQQRFLVGERRPRVTTGLFVGHFNPLKDARGRTPETSSLAEGLGLPQGALAELPHRWQRLCGEDAVTSIVQRFYRQDALMAFNRGANVVASVITLITAFFFAAPARSATLEELVSAVVRVKTYINPDGQTVQSLGREREGSGVVIDEDGLVLTIGYLMVEAHAAEVRTNAGRTVPATIVGYDHETGFGILKTIEPLKIRPLSFGRSADVKAGDPV